MRAAAVVGFVAVAAATGDRDEDDDCESDEQDIL
jgi:hypothetical protein